MNTTKFWENVDVGEKSECWEWRRYRMAKGYGLVKYQGKTWYAHRLAWTFVNGLIPEGMCVLHKCDCPPCVNPSHLFIGTIADNNADMFAKGRHADFRGEKHSRSKLVNAQVLEIRRRYAVGNITQRELAKEFGVGQSNINSIVNRKTWRHI